MAQMDLNDYYPSSSNLPRLRLRRRDDGDEMMRKPISLAIWKSCDQAQGLAQELETGAAALVAWNGESRGADDVTGHFKQEAKARGMSLAEVKTI